MNERAQFGPELRRLRVDAGLSLTELAGRIHYSKGYLSKVETGVALPNHTLAALCDTELDTGGRLVRLLPYIRRRSRGRPGALASTFSALPPGPEHFLGRSSESAAVAEALTRGRTESAAVCVVDGMAGVGKSALAVCCARGLEHHFSDGCLFLDMHGYTRDVRAVEPAEALDRFLRVLGVSGEDIPGDVDDRAALYREQLRGRKVLVVLDNINSVQQVRLLLPAERTCAVLITSRHRLDALDDAQHVSLSTLSPMHGNALFRAVAGERATAEDAIVDRIVRRCGMLPLAIRIAAARFRGNKMWSLADLDGRLADQVAPLAQLDDGERSVEAAFQLSYQQLSVDERQIFGVLALHPGASLDCYSVAALGGTRVQEAELLLNRLETAHLLVQCEKGRYQFHDLIGVFAAERALPEIDKGTRRSAVHRLFDLELHSLEAADRLITPHRYRPRVVLDALPAEVRKLPDRDAAMSWLSTEWANLVACCRMATDIGMRRRCWEFAYGLRGYFFLVKLWDPWIETHTLAVTAARSENDPLAQAMALNNLGLARIGRGELDAAGACYQDALLLSREIGDEHGATTALANYAWVKHYDGMHEAALHDLRTAMEFYERSGVRRNAAITLRGIAFVETEVGMFDAALVHAQEALGVFGELDLDLDATMALNCLGWTYFRAGRHAESAEMYRRAAERGERCGSRYETARAETGLGNVEAAADRMRSAQYHWDRARELYPDEDVTMGGEIRDRLAAIRRSRLAARE